jgi:hypothetical protein
MVHIALSSHFQQYTNNFEVLASGLTQRIGSQDSNVITAYE